MGLCEVEAPIFHPMDEDPQGLKCLRENYTSHL